MIEIHLLGAVFEGELKGNTVGVFLTATMDTPPEALELAARLGIGSVQEKYPGVVNARCSKS